MLHLDIDTTRRAVFLKSAVYSVLQIKKQQTLTNSMNKMFSYLPANWLDKCEEVNGDFIDNEAILYIKQQGMGYYTQLHASIFTVGQLIQGSIGKYGYDIHKFIVYVLLILSLI